MAIIRVRLEHLRSPEDSSRVLIKTESAEDCDGIACGATRVPFDELGIYPKPHYHLVVSGEEPRAAARYYPFWEPAS